VLEEARQTKLQNDQADSIKVCNESFQTFPATLKSIYMVQQSISTRYISICRSSELLGYLALQLRRGAGLDRLYLSDWLGCRNLTPQRYICSRSSSG
jgi:hypothetical protein